MKQAIKLASCGLYTSYPNPAVGCVIVRDGKVIGRGFHHKAGLPHAEIMALQDASFDVEGATVYVTLEPCSHYGRTPPCAKKLVECKVAKVVVACRDPNPKVSGRGFQILKDAGIEVVEHVLEKEALFSSRAFMKSIVKGIPYVAVKTGMSLDAKTALCNGKSKWITNNKSRAKVQDIRAKSDCIITSSNTVIADDPKLNVRYEELKEKYRKKIDFDCVRQPLKVVLDSNGKLDISKYQIFTSGHNLLVLASDNLEELNKETIINENVSSVYIIRSSDGHIDINALLEYLGTKQIRKVLVEAGSNLISAFLNANAVDEIYAFVAPKLLGERARDAFNTQNVLDLSVCREFNLHKTKRYGNDVLLHYLLED